MSDERIDLTQFEGTIAEGKWHEHIHEPKEDGYERVASIVVSGVVAPPYTLQTNEGHTFATVEMGDLTAHLPLFMMVPDLIAELKRCYKELDELPTRQELMDIFDYQKWLEYVESYFLADGSLNAKNVVITNDFVRKCAVNNKYGYRIEVIDGVETVVHESEDYQFYQKY